MVTSLPAPSSSWSAPPGCFSMKLLTSYTCSLLWDTQSTEVTGKVTFIKASVVPNIYATYSFTGSLTLPLTATCTLCLSFSLLSSCHVNLRTPGSLCTELAGSRTSSPPPGILPPSLDLPPSKKKRSSSAKSSDHQNRILSVFSPVFRIT